MSGLQESAGASLNCRQAALEREMARAAQALLAPMNSIDWRKLRFRTEFAAVPFRNWLQTPRQAGCLSSKRQRQTATATTKATTKAGGEHGSGMLRIPSPYRRQRQLRNTITISDAAACALCENSEWAEMRGVDRAPERHGKTEAPVSRADEGIE